MRNYIYLAVSLDGYIAGKDGNLDWLNSIPNPDGGDYGFSDFMAGIDALAMGRNTYEQVLGFGAWPYTKPVFVLSESLKQGSSALAGKKVAVLSGKPKEIIKKIKESGYSRLYVDGGKVIQSFLKEDLIDEMIITRIPIVLGGGIPLFGSLEQSLLFTHAETQVLNSSLVKSRYLRDRK